MASTYTARLTLKSLLTQCIYINHATLTTNSDYCPTQHSSIGLSNGNTLRILWCTKYIFVYKTTNGVLRCSTQISQWCSPLSESHTVSRHKPKCLLIFTHKRNLVFPVSILMKHKNAHIIQISSGELTKNKTTNMEITDTNSSTSLNKFGFHWSISPKLTIA